MWMPGSVAGEATIDGSLDAARIRAVAFDGDQAVAEVTGEAGQPLDLPIPDARLWSPDSPFLYDLQVTLLQGETAVDEVTSYFGMRKIAIAPDENGVPRIFLNNAPLFNFGLLDQGFWPDRLYTAPTDEALRYDIEVTRQLGFNMIRKHVKVEPERWYYWADRLGVLVWRTCPAGMPCSAPGSEITRG
jgi:beta-galactosidase/beta-glucuronidase